MVVLNLAQHHDRATFDLRVLCLGETGTLAPRFEALGVPTEGLHCPPGALRQTVCRLTRRLRQLRPHVLHTHNPSPHIFGALAACAARVPVLVHTKHGRNSPDVRRKVALNRWASCLSSCIVPVSEDAAEVVRLIERVPARKVCVIRNGIDLAAFPTAPAPRPARGNRAIHVARLNLVKDQRTLLRAARLVADAEPAFRLDLVGDGPARAEVEALRTELALDGHVRFLGYREDVRDLLAAADFFVLSSVSEGISLTLLEAMAMGLPVAATDVGGNREVVAQGETGLLVPAQSPAALAEAMLVFLRNPERARRMGAAGRRRVEERFDLRRVVREYEALYLNLLEKKRVFRPAPLAGGK
jgi:glycosyltransferase involved in cell wall biosynthesis